MWLMSAVQRADPENHCLLFVMLLLAELATGLMMSHRALRKDAGHDEKSPAKPGAPENSSKKSLRVFLAFYLLPFSIAAAYFQSLKIFDYALIVLAHWTLMRDWPNLSAVIFGVTSYHNVLYSDLALVALMKLRTLGQRTRFVAVAAATFIGCVLAAQILGGFPCQLRGLFELNDYAPQLSIYWYWNLEVSDT